MDRKIDINLIIWLVFLLLLFGGSLIRWLIQRFGRKKEEEATPQERPPTFMEEFKKMLEGMAMEERPEIVTVEEKLHKRRSKHRKVGVPKEAPPTLKPISKLAVSEVSMKEEKPAVPAPTLPGVSLSQVLPKDELQKAVVLSEVLGPPRARRRHYRLF